MLIKLTRVSCNAAGSKETSIWLNSNHIAKVEPCTIHGDKAKSYVSIKDEYAWRDIKVKESPEEIAKMINGVMFIDSNGNVTRIKTDHMY